MKKVVMASALLMSCNLFAYESNFDQMYLRGTFNNWGSNTAMSLIDDHIWQVGISLTDSDQFKFEISGSDNWSTNFGDDNSDGIAETYGANISAPATAAYYYIRFNDETLSYSYNITTHVYFDVATAGIYPAQLIGGAELSIYHDGVFAYNSTINYGTYGNWYNSIQPVGTEVTVELNEQIDGGIYRINDIYQGKTTFTVEPQLLTQNIEVKTCGGTELKLRRSPADGGESYSLMECVDGIWEGTVSLYPSDPNDEPRAFYFLQGDMSSGNAVLYGDDNADGIAAEDEDAITVDYPASYNVSMNLNTMEYSVEATNSVTFSTYVYMPTECWMEIRGNKAPLSWSEGIYLDNAAGGTLPRGLTLPMTEGSFEYKYTKVCTSGTMTWETGSNRVGPPSGVDYPSFN